MLLWWKEETASIDRILQWQTISEKLLDVKYELLERVHVFKRGSRPQSAGYSKAIEDVLINTNPFKTRVTFNKNQLQSQKQDSMAEIKTDLQCETPVADGERLVLRRWWRFLAKYSEICGGTEPNNLGAAPNSLDVHHDGLDSVSKKCVNEMSTSKVRLVARDHRVRDVSR